MKFNCDKSKQRARAKLEAFWDKHVNKWTKHYAWLPVKVAEGDCRWLEEVEKKYIPNKSIAYTGNRRTPFREEEDISTERFIFLSNFFLNSLQKQVEERGCWVYRPLGGQE